MSTQIYQTYSFLPTKISGCQLWLDGADLTTLFTDSAGTTAVTATGQNVAYWKDKSTQANNATNATNPPTVTYNVQNGLPAITFNGSQSLSLTPSKLPNGSTNFSYFFVVRTSSSAVQVFMANGTTVTNQMPQFYFNNYALVGDLFGGSATSDGTTYNNQFVVATYTASSTFTGYDFDSTFSGSAASVTLNTGTTWALLGVSRVATPDFAFYFTGQIAEVIVYNRVVTTSEREQIQAYLGWKWDLETNFTSGFTYKMNPPFMNTIQLPVTPTRPIPVTNAAVFVPTQISGCQLWLDATDSSKITLSGASVTQWKDKVSGITMTTQGTTANATLVKGINGNQAIYFNNSASDSVYMSGTFANLLVGTAFYVIQAFSQRTISWRPFATWWNTGQFPAYGYLGLTTVNTVGPYTTFASPNGTPTQVLTAGSNYMISYGWSGTTTYVTTNGSALETGSQQSYNSNTSTFWIGADGTGATERITLYYGEMIFYNSVLTTTQRQQVEGYLAWKWGLQATLPTTHPYYKSPFPNQSMAPIPAFPPQIRAVSWQPTNISNISVWLDAADSAYVSVSGTAVTQWKDKSGQNNNTSSANGSPQYVQASLNKRAGIKLNGSTSYFTLPRVVTTDWSIFIVLTTTQTGPGSGGQWWAGAGIFDAEVGGTTTDFGTSLYGSSFATGVGNPPTGDNTILSSTAINTGAGFICEFIRNSTSGLFENFVNGTSQGSVTGGTGARTTSQIVIGAIQTLGAGTFFNGSMFEIITYTSVLTTKQRQQLEGYLAWKWGLQGSLPSTHPYKLFPPPP
jgi:hypothetical protein